MSNPINKYFPKVFGEHSTPKVFLEVSFKECITSSMHCAKLGFSVSPTALHGVRMYT